MCFVCYVQRHWSPPAEPRMQRCEGNPGQFQCREQAEPQSYTLWSHRRTGFVWCHASKPEKHKSPFQKSSLNQNSLQHRAYLDCISFFVVIPADLIEKKNCFAFESRQLFKQDCFPRLCCSFSCLLKFCGHFKSCKCWQNLSNAGGAWIVAKHWRHKGVHLKGNKVQFNYWILPWVVEKGWCMLALVKQKTLLNTFCFREVFLKCWGEPRQAGCGTAQGLCNLS